MADTTTKADLQDEVDRLRGILADNGIDPDTEVDPTAGIVGNLADLQRLGKLAVNSGKTNVDDAVVVPASANDAEGTSSPAQTVSGKDPSEVV